MKTIIAALIGTAALIGAANAETVSGTLRSFDQVTGTIVLENGKAYSVSRTDDDFNDIIRPIPSGTSVTLQLEGATKAVTDIFPGAMGMTDSTMTSSTY